MRLLGGEVPVGGRLTRGEKDGGERWYTSPPQKNGGFGLEDTLGKGKPSVSDSGPESCDGQEPDRGPPSRGRNPHPNERHPSFYRIFILHPIPSGPKKGITQRG